MTAENNLSNLKRFVTITLETIGDLINIKANNIKPEARIYKID